MKECLLKSALIQGPFALIFLSAHGYNCQGVFVIIKDLLLRPTHFCSIQEFLVVLKV